MHFLRGGVAAAKRIRMDSEAQLVMKRWETWEFQMLTVVPLKDDAVTAFVRFEKCSRHLVNLFLLPWKPFVLHFKELRKREMVKKQKQNKTLTVKVPTFIAVVVVVVVLRLRLRSNLPERTSPATL